METYYNPEDLAKFGTFLVRTGNLNGYLKKLLDAFNPDALPGMMCRSQISVAWDGKVYACVAGQGSS